MRGRDLQVRVTGPRLLDREAWVLQALAKTIEKHNPEALAGENITIRLRDLVAACYGEGARGRRYFALEAEVVSLLLRIQGLRHWVSVGRNGRGRRVAAERRVGPLIRIIRRPRIWADEGEEEMEAAFRPPGGRTITVRLPDIAEVPAAQLLEEAIASCWRGSARGCA